MDSILPLKDLQAEETSAASRLAATAEMDSLRLVMLLW